MGVLVLIPDASDLEDARANFEDALNELEKQLENQLVRNSIEIDGLMKDVRAGVLGSLARVQSLQDESRVLRSELWRLQRAFEITD